MNRKRWIILCVTLILATLSATLISCNKNDDVDNDINPLLDLTKDVTIVFAGNDDTWPEMEKVITKFETKYPNCTVKYEYIENYLGNIATRLAGDENKVDVFYSSNILPDTDYKEYAYNLISDDAKKYLDLSKADKGLVDNFKYTGAENTQYAVPYAGEVRGLYVNKTLLNSLNLQTPTTWSELLTCCETLKTAGYVPIQAAIGNFGQQFIYPYICNTIVSQNKYDDVENIDAGISELFRDAYGKLYTLVENGYYNYKAVEETYKYSFGSSTIKACNFLDIDDYNDDGIDEKSADDVGKIAFMTDTQSFYSYIDKAKSDYHSDIEYEFILAPVTEEGGYGYVSPSGGLAVNNKSDNIDWALEFLDFIFTPEVNVALAADENKVPNTQDMSVAMDELDVTNDRICTVGDVTFSYAFYKTVVTLTLTGYDDMIGITKLNAPKYMVPDGQGGTKFAYTLDQYIARLETEFQKVKAARTTS